MPTIPIACTLDAAAVLERQGVLGRLIVRASARHEVPEGYSFRFDDGAVALSEIAAVIEPERRCCPFLRFVVTVESESGPISLELTGPEGTKKFLSGLLSLG